jgi:hypothetical protein
VLRRQLPDQSLILLLQLVHDVPHRRPLLPIVVTQVHQRVLWQRVLRPNRQQIYKSKSYINCYRVYRERVIISE